MSTKTMKMRRIPAGRTVNGRVRVPASKSVAQRNLALALVARVGMRLEHVTAAEDPRLFAAALEACGFDVSWREDVLTVTPPDRAAKTDPSMIEIFCGNGGTMCRFLTAVLTAVPGRFRLGGVPRLHERPIGPLVGALHQLGADIRYLENEGYPPIEIVGGSLEGGQATLDAGESSQYLSAILLAGQGAKRAIDVTTTRLASSPYVELTVRAIQSRGGAVEVMGPTNDGVRRYRVEGSARAGRRIQGGTIDVDGDDSAAAYPAAAAALAGGRVRIAGLATDSVQGDRGVLDLLARMGTPVAWQDGDVVVSRARALEALDVDLSLMPDQVPTLAALAPFARGQTTIRGVAHLRIKESDRLAAMACELGRLGVPVTETEDGLVIEGVWANGEPPRDDIEVETYGDHRIAMALALVGLRRPGVLVKAPEVVEKSYPGFWTDLASLLNEDDL